MDGAPQRYSAKASSDERSNRRSLSYRQNHRQRPRPESNGEIESQLVENCKPERLVKISDMDDQRIETGPPLCRVYASDRFTARCIGSEAVDRFRRDRDDLSCEDQGGSLGHRFGTVRKDLRLRHGELGL
jgi:hypothetical protein